MGILPEINVYVGPIAQIPHGSSRLDSTRSTCRASRDERVEASCAVPTWRTTNKL